MWKAAIPGIFILAALLPAQNGQNVSRPGWPCVPGKAVDPSYLEISESTGGQLFLFQKNEAGQSGVVMGASRTHPATVLRAVGSLNGTRDFEFPVDSSIASLLVLVSLQCRNAIRVTRPAGSELTEANSAFSADLQAGRILRVDSPEAGPWRIRLTGSGLFVLSVLAKAEVSLTGIAFPQKAPLFGLRQDVQARISGDVSQLGLQLVDAGGNRISDVETVETAGEGAYRSRVTAAAQRFRILITGTDGSAWPFQRMYPILFHAEQTK